MYKKFFNFLSAATLATLFVSCAQLAPTEPTDSNAKVFPQEDAFIMFALRAESIGDNQAAADLFSMAYDKARKKEYLYRALSNEIAAGNNEKAIAAVDESSKGSLDDFKLVRLKIIALIQAQKLDEALALSTALVKKSEAASDYTLASDVYIRQAKYDIALKYLESAYVKDYNEEVLNKMSIILYVNLQRKKDAIAQLETHSRMMGCSQLICNRLIGFYSNENDVDGILSTYLRMYDAFESPEIANKIIQIYGYKKNYLKMIEFLERSNSNDETLLELYSVTKNYKKAFLLADKLYASSGEISFLGQSAIYEYESNEKKDDETVLKSVISKLERVIREDSNPMYENYLGYVLIDHELDVKKGMRHIRKVLKLQPESAFYLDSLAWGYYKLGNSEKAKSIMDKVVKLEGGDDPEVKEHMKEIKNSLQNKKVKNKK